MSRDERTSESPAPERPLRGTRIGRYRLAYEIASGGMATVYIASVEGPAGVDQVVALKRIHRHLAKQKSYVEMFLDEARLASRIRHPNVCMMTDFGEEEGEYFIAMEYLHGMPLSRVIKKLGRRARREPVPARWPAMASKLVAEACEGLHAAHEIRAVDGELLGVVHRDVSPQNLFVGFDGVLRVVDFGIAKAADKLHQTETAEFKGKIAYMAPEQLEKGEVDRRTDVWALGVVLWEAISLRRLFRRSQEAQTMYAVLEHEVSPISETAPGVPEALDGVLYRALDRDVDQRTPDARTLGRDIMRTWGQVLEHPVDSAEIGDLMAELFPGEKDRQASLVEIARMSRDEIPIVGKHADISSEFSGLSKGDSAKAFQRLDRESGDSLAPRRKLWIAAIIGGVSLVLGLIIGGLFLLPMLGRDQGADAALATVTPGDVADASSGDPLTAGAEEEGRRERRDAAVGGAPDQASLAPSTPPDATEPSAGAAPNGTAKSAVAALRPGKRAPLAEREPRPRDREPPPEHHVSPSSEGANQEEAEPPPPEEPAGDRAEREEPATGTVIVVVPGGWANVYNQRGRLLGVTPLRQTLPAGRHVLSLRYFGQPPPEQVAVTVEPNGTARVSRRAPER